ncbi:MAG: 50S ribosomal protein L24 [Candidatus Aenigmatarchaeota archaeon]
MVRSKKPKKQRKEVSRTPLHRRQRKVSALLERSLREEFDRRNLPLRSGDEVRIMKGDFKGTEDEVHEVDLRKQKVTLEDLNVEKVDGTEVRPKIDPSNLMILDPDLSDKMRSKIVERAGGEVSEEFTEAESEEEEEEEEGKKEEGFRCEICGDVFDSKRGLNIHKGQKHPEYMK